MSRLGTLNITTARPVVLVQLRGSSCINATEGEFELRRGDWMVLDRDSHPIVQTSSEGLCIGMFLPSGQDLLTRDHPIHVGMGNLRLRERRMLFRLWRQVLDQAVQQQEGRWEIQSMLRYFADLQRDFRVQLQRCPGRTSSHRQQIFSRLQRTRLYLLGHRGKTTRSTALAAVANLSSCYFSRTYTVVYDERPQATSSRLRLEHAAELLRESNRPIAEIALASGFENCCSFARAFRAHFGTSASIYRREGPTSVSPDSPAQSGVHAISVKIPRDTPVERGEIQASVESSLN